MKTRVAMIIPYFGQWPEWMDLYLYSCSRNPKVDFLFFTDCPIPVTVYSNTLFTTISFKEYCEHVSHVLDINFRPMRAYKLCDLKVFYGLIHAGNIKDYDFWAFGDVDLIFGNLDLVINDKNLSKYNLITTHSYHVGGHFTVVRRESLYTSLCLQIPSWQKLLSDTKNYSIDEGIWSALAYPQLKNVARVFRYLVRPLFHIQYFTYLTWANKLFCNRFTHILYREYYTTPNPLPSQCWTFQPLDNKVLRYDGLELPYLHLIGWRKCEYALPDGLYWNKGIYKLPINWKPTSGKLIFISHNGIWEG